MLNPSLVTKIMRSPLLTTTYTTGDHETSPAALPDASLDFLVSLCRELNAQKIVEFGSGRSTKAMLDTGCYVTSIEHSDYWMQQTVETLTKGEKSRHTPLVKPLKTQFLGFFPVFDWQIDNEIMKHLKEAELILVDSPYYAPFRESTLWSSLKIGKKAVVILDDTRIPTLSRFCSRLADSNRSLLHRRVAVGHTFDVFYQETDSELTLNHSLIDIMKGWNRYFQGLKFHSKPS